MKLLEQLKWRYATKNFDSQKDIDADKLNLLIEAVRLSPSSYGLQLYKVLIVKDKEIRAKLREVSWNQPQITDSSALVIFCNYTEVTDEHVNDYIKLKAEIENLDIKQIEGYGNMMKSKIAAMSKENRKAWTKRQTYIALGILLSAAAELEIDSCPMEGFNSNKYNEILGLNKENLSAAVVAAIGYRSVHDKNQFKPKVRKPSNELFEIIGSEKTVLNF